MAVITISRGSFSGGKMLAECVADSLGYRCVDREVIVEKAAAYGVSQAELRDALDKPPTFLDRFKHRRYVYVTLIQAALADEVQHGRAVYHGNAGHLLLKDGVNILRVRIIAPMEFRVAMIQRRLKYSREEAVAYIQKMDEDRRKWTQFLYGVDWGDPSLYDLVLNLESVDIPGACAIVAAAAKRSCFAETAEALEAMADLALASRVRASLAVNATTSSLEVDVVARRGAVSIKGKIFSERQVDEIERVVSRIPGITDASLNELLLVTPV